MNRRKFLAAAALGATSLAGCAASPNSSLRSRQALSAQPPGGIADALVQPISAGMMPVKSSLDRVTRTIVGLRPFRKPGPRLQAVKLGAKDVVHNYGHGGGGVSLSWGVAELAAALVKDFGRRDVAVLGSGVIGLSTALQLQRAGAGVTIYAKDFPPYTTSNVAGAMWHPVTLFEREQVSHSTLQMLDLASQIAFRRFIGYANDPTYGVYWIRQYSLSEASMDTSTPYIGGDSLYPGLVRNQKNGPFGFAYHDAYYTLMIDPDIYLRALMRDFTGAGGKLREVAFETADDVEALAERSIVNCTGLGAARLFDDESLIPARGQLSFLLPQNDIDYGYAGVVREHGLLYTFPRKTGILLGGSVDKNDWDLNPREDEVQRMVEGHAAMAARLS
ncbi:FAD-dependent oxidoreductase [Congregibacter litoralis]|uniref:D-amino-acid oxidase n=1 Tax=Congregibacter litoralis KT71 TaxID=314285 RepID=A4A6B3_9GAMM|nr:FAD-dependent oxidoreductase [Congregibacter litoralis]EAQ98560.2 FAD dependent oxidoreductase [Congregibacter litoralis KT71]